MPNLSAIIDLAMEYQHGAPSPEAEQIDSEMASRMTCECGNGMRYDAWHRPGSYIALAVCPKCGREVAF